jgi:hypothetical protein
MFGRMLLVGRSFGNACEWMVWMNALFPCRASTKHHNALTVKAIAGLGVDRHMMGLRLLAGRGIVPVSATTAATLSHPAMSLPWELSTSAPPLMQARNVLLCCVLLSCRVPHVPPMGPQWAFHVPMYPRGSAPLWPCAPCATE